MEETLAFCVYGPRTLTLLLQRHYAVQQERAEYSHQVAHGLLATSVLVLAQHCVVLAGLCIGVETESLIAQRYFANGYGAPAGEQPMVGRGFQHLAGEDAWVAVGPSGAHTTNSSNRVGA